MCPLTPPLHRTPAAAPSAPEAGCPSALLVLRPCIDLPVASFGPCSYVLSPEDGWLSAPTVQPDNYNRTQILADAAAWADKYNGASPNDVLLVPPALLWGSRPARSARPRSASGAL